MVVCVELYNEGRFYMDLFVNEKAVVIERRNMICKERKKNYYCNDDVLATP